MFEQAVLSGAPTGRRAWMAGAGLASQALVVSLAILGPLLWPESLPKMQAMWMTPTAPVAPHPVEPTATPRAPHQSAPVFDAHALTVPTKIPDHPVMIDDPAPDGSSPIAGAIPGLKAGNGSNLVDNILGAMPTGISKPVEVAKPAVKPVEKPQPPEIARVRIGGDVQMPRLIRQIQPLYPPIARTARVHGAVELSGVIGVDGRIRELKVVSGHVLLTKAALDAVAQWLYEPTRLNGQAVEVITTVVVTFRMD